MDKTERAIDALRHDIAQLRERIDRTHGKLYDELSVGGPAGGAPTDAAYLVAGLDARLSAERVLTEGWGIDLTDGGAGGSFTIVASQTDLDARYRLAGAIAHDTLTGLGDDDHPQYLRIDGARAMTGDLYMGSMTPHAIYNVSTINHIDFSSFYSNYIMHTSDPDAHHDEATAGNGISLSGQEVSLDLASSWSGLEFVVAGGVRVDYGAMFSWSAQHWFAADVVFNGNVGIGGTPSYLLDVSQSGARLRFGTETEDGYLYVGQTGDVNFIEIDPNNEAIKIAAASVSLGDTEGATTSAVLTVDVADEEFQFENGDIYLGSGDITALSDLAITPGGSLTLDPTGDVIFNPGGDDVLPYTNYDVNLGSLTKKYLSIHAAELWVQSLVAQDTVATIGGRIVVAETTELIADVGTLDTSIDVKHNFLVSGDRIWLEADGKLEWLAITSGATPISGGYRYSVTRDLDGTGANAWYAGDAAVNTGTTGDGFIDIYSVSGILGSSYGPTIAGNIRSGTAYDAIVEGWAIGNLNGLYGYATDTYGVGLGQYAAASAHITVDPTNGIRFYDGLTTVVGHWEPGGDLTLGEVATDKANLFWDASAGRVNLRGGTDGTVVGLYLDADGSMVFGGGSGRLDADGLTLDVSGSISSDAEAVKWVDGDDDEIARVTAYTSVGNHNLYVWAQDPDGDTFTTAHLFSGDASERADVYARSYAASGSEYAKAGMLLKQTGPEFYIMDSGTAATKIAIFDDLNVRMEHGLRVGGIANNAPYGYVWVDDGVSIDESSTPTHSITESAQVDVYLKDDKLVFRFDDGGTMRYKYLDLSGTGVTWVHTTSAP